MSTAAERKKAKEAYLLSLQQQKETLATETKDSAPDSSAFGQAVNSNNGAQTAASRREQILAEKRKAFFEGKDQEKKSESTNQASMFPNPAPSVKPSLFESNPAVTNNLFAPAPTSSIHSNINTEPQPKVKKPDPFESAAPRLSDWQKLGFASEYAYAKQLGYLNEKPNPKVDPISAPFEEVKRPTDNSRQQQQQQQQQQNAVDFGGFRFSEEKDKESIRRQQNEYATQLKGQLSSFPTSSVPPSHSSQAPGILSFPEKNEQELKRAKQENYAKELESQLHSNHSSLGSQPTASLGGGGLSSIGGPAVDSADLKRQKQAEYARALQQDQLRQDGPSSSQLSYQQPPSSYNSNNNAGGGGGGGGGLGFGQAPSKEEKRLKQQEYAQALQHDQHATPGSSHYQPPLQQQRQDYRAGGLGSIPEMGGGRGGGITGLGGAISKDEKRQRQLEYAQALQHDQQVGGGNGFSAQPLPSKQFHQPAPVAAGGGFAIGSQLSKDEKRLKQQEYAQALQHDQHATPGSSHYQPPPQQQRQDYRAGPSQGMGGGGGGGGGGGITGLGGDISKDEKRHRQLEYAQALQHDQSSLPIGPGGAVQQQNQRGRGQLQQQSSSATGGGLAAIGSQPSKDEKRQRQLEYAQALQKDQHSQPVSVPSSSQAKQHLFGGDSALPSAYQSAAAYPSNPYQQQQQQPSMGYQQPPYQPQLPQSYQQQTQAQAQAQAQVSSFQIGGDPNSLADKEQRKAKQKEYALALQQQLNLKNNNHGHPPGALAGGHQQQIELLQQQQEQAPAANGLGPGWVMGPLGVPVRKTLEVGRRGIQKAYVDQVVNHSPQKPVAMGMNFHSSPPQAFQGFPNPTAAGYGGNPNPSNQHLFGPDTGNNNNYLFGPAGDSHYGNNPAAMMGGPAAGPGLGLGGAGLGFVPSAAAAAPAASGGDLLSGFDFDGDAKRKQLQLQQQRALEEQIRLNKAKVEAEKKAAEELERKEQMRIEKEQREIKEAFDKEQAKVKASEENKKLLEAQIELKKQEKVEKERQEKERERVEELKVEKERQELARREELERQKELEDMRKKQKSSAAPPPASRPKSRGEVAAAGAGSNFFDQLPDQPSRRAKLDSLFGGGEEEDGGLRNPIVLGAKNNPFDELPVGAKKKEKKPRQELFDPPEEVEEVSHQRPAHRHHQAQPPSPLKDGPSSRPSTEQRRRLERRHFHQDEDRIFGAADPVDLVELPAKKPPKHAGTPPRSNLSFLEEIAQNLSVSSQPPLSKTLPNESKFLFPDGRVMDITDIFSAAADSPLRETSASTHSNSNKTLSDRAAITSAKRETRPPSSSAKHGDDWPQEPALVTPRPMQVERETITTPSLLRDLVHQANPNPPNPSQATGPSRPNTSFQRVSSRQQQQRPTQESQAADEQLYGFRPSSSSSSRPSTQQILQRDDGPLPASDPNAFSIEKELKKNQRKWQLLQKLNNVQTNEMKIKEIFNDKVFPESALYQQRQSSGQAVKNLLEETTSSHIQLPGTPSSPHRPHSRPVTSHQTTHHNSSSMRDSLRGSLRDQLGQGQWQGNGQQESSSNKSSNVAAHAMLLFDRPGSSSSDQPPWNKQPPAASRDNHNNPNNPNNNHQHQQQPWPVASPNPKKSAPRSFSYEEVDDDLYNQFGL